MNAEKTNGKPVRKTEMSTEIVGGG